MYNQHSHLDVLVTQEIDLKLYSNSAHKKCWQYLFAGYFRHSNRNSLILQIIKSEVCNSVNQI